MECFKDKLLSPETRSSPARGHIKPNISEQLRPSLSLITSPVIMTWIIVGPGRLFPLVKIWVCLWAYRTSHRGWIKSCSLSGQPSKNLTSSSQSPGEMNRKWRWIDSERSPLPAPTPMPQGMGLMLQQLGPEAKLEPVEVTEKVIQQRLLKILHRLCGAEVAHIVIEFRELKVLNDVNYSSKAKTTKKKRIQRVSSTANVSVFASAC